jgi:hypothetical protein
LGPLACSSIATAGASRSSGRKPCGKLASYRIDGVPKCSQHAGKAAIAFLIEESRASAAD